MFELVVNSIINQGQLRLHLFTLLSVVLLQRYIPHVLLMAIIMSTYDVEQIQVDCYPFNDIMTAAGVRHINYFAVDIEGAELDVLRTIDWDELRIDVLTIEYHWEGRFYKPKLMKMRKLLAGLKIYRQIHSNGEDLVYARRDLTHTNQ